MDFPSLRLSQAQLNLFSTCPRKFQHIYLEQSVTPVPLGQQERARWGNQFHLLMQQRELALPVGPLLQAEPQLEETVQRCNGWPRSYSLANRELGVRRSTAVA